MKGCPWMWVKGSNAVLITWSGPSGFCSSLMACRRGEEARGRERKGEETRLPGGKGGKNDLAGNNNSNL